MIKPTRFLSVRFTLPALLILAIATSAGAASPALANPESPNSETLRLAASDRKAKSELSAGGVKAEFSQASTQALFSAGSSVFTEITLTNEGESDKVLADLVLEAEQGEIKNVSGKDVSRAEDGGTHVVRIDNLKKGKPRKIVVETALAGEAPTSGGRGESRMVVTLRRPAQPEYETKEVVTSVRKSYCRRYGTYSTWRGTRRRCVRWGKRTVKKRKTVRIPIVKAEASSEPVPSDSTILVWAVSNCAQAFHAELAKLMETKGSRMGDALKAARTRDRRRPGSWMFRPESASSKRTCVKRSRYWDRRRGRYRSRCVEYESASDGEPETGTPKKQVRAVHRLANTFVRSRAIDPEMSTRKNFGWVSQKVATDLRGYLKQDPHPAICTGAVQFVDYFDGRLGEFFERGDKFDKSAKTARSIAVERVAAARKAVSKDPSGHPAWGAMPISLAEAKPAPGSSLQNLVVETARLTSNGDLVSEVKEAENAYDALKVMNSWMKKDGKEMNGDSRKAVRRALGAIEAADYLQVVAGHYGALNDTLKGSIIAVRDAHGRHCKCDT